MSIREVLAGVAPETLGFDPNQVPDDVTVKLPMALVKPQLSTGKVSVTLADVAQGCLDKYRPAFAKADPALAVSLPMESVFHKLPVEEQVPAAPAEAPAASPFEQLAPAPAPTNPAESAEAPFPTPFGQPAQGQAEVGASQLPPGEAAAPAPASPFGDPPEPETGVPDPPSASPFAALPPLGSAPANAEAPAPAPKEDDASAPFGSPNGNAGSSSPFLEDPAPAARAPGVPDPAAPWSLPPEPAPSAPASASGAISEPLQPFGELPGSQQAQALPSFDSLPVSGAASAQGDPEPTSGFEGARFDGGGKDQLALRALLGADGRVDAHAVVEHCTSLPGIDACVLVSENGDLEAGSGEFGVSAAATLEHAKGLAGGLGVSGAETLTVRTDEEMVSFFKATPVYLGVRHGNQGFQPGVQEKLVLLSRELAKMAG